MADPAGAPAAAAAGVTVAARGREPPGLSPAQRAELAAVQAAARERRQLANAARAAGDRPGAGAGSRPFGVDYVEFRISEMRDTRGGFMAEEALPEELGGKRRRRDNDRRREPVLVSDPLVAAPRCIAIHLPLESNPLCEKCQTPEIDGKFWRWYQVAICPQCRLSGGDMYRMITKSEAKEDFLVTDSELDKLKFVTRPNPHNANWKDMKLYLYKHVYDYAISKWGSEEKLNEAYIARTENKKPAKRRTAFAKSVDEMARADRAAVAVNKALAQHEHEFGPGYQDSDDNNTWKQSCACGFSITFEPL